MVENRKAVEALSAVFDQKAAMSNLFLDRNQVAANVDYPHCEDGTEPWPTPLKKATLPRAGGWKKSCSSPASAATFDLPQNLPSN